MVVLGVHCQAWNVPVTLCAALFVAVGLVAPGAEEWVTVSTRGPIVVDTTHARERLGWKPKYTAQEALDNVAAAWNEISDRLGRAEQLAQYKAAVGYEG